MEPDENETSSPVAFTDPTEDADLTEYELGRLTDGPVYLPRTEDA